MLTRPAFSPAGPRESLRNRSCWRLFLVGSCLSPLAVSNILLGPPRGGGSEVAGLSYSTGEWIWWIGAGGGGRAPCGFMGCGMGSTIAQCEGCGVLQDGIFSNRMQCSSERAWEKELPRQCSCGTVHFLHLWGSRAQDFCALMVGGRLGAGGACVQIQRGRSQWAGSERAGPVCRALSWDVGCWRVRGWVRGWTPRCATVVTVPSGRRSDLGPSLGHFHAERPGQVTHLPVSPSPLL